MRGNVDRAEKILGNKVQSCSFACRFKGICMIVCVELKLGCRYDSICK